MKSFDEIIATSYAYNEKQFRGHLEWGVLRNLYERNFICPPKKDFSVFPKRIHQIWLGSKFPIKYKEWAASWKQHNPDWEYCLWIDDNIGQVHIENRQCFDAITSIGLKSDILRYHILNQFGGLYVDTDFECLKSFDSLTYAEFITGIGYPMSPELYIGLIGSVAHHPITERLVAEINKTIDKIKPARIFDATGSYFFTRIFFDVVKEYMPKVLALPFNYFYPFPNNKERDLIDGHTFIEKESYAIHYWEVSWTTKSKTHDWIMGEKFWGIADMVYTPKQTVKDDYSKLKNTFNPANLKETTIVYTHTMYVQQLFNVIRYLKGSFIVITHNSDVNITSSNGLPDNVVMWYGQNICIKHPRMKALPIGLANTMWDRQINKRAKIVEVLKIAKKIKNTVYVRVKIKTNPVKRNKILILKGKSWVTFEDNEVPFDHYINQVYTHKFVACPEGNGIDTVRMWETLYMGSYPIVLDSQHTQFFKELPICIVNDWKEVTEEFLLSWEQKALKKDWNKEMLDFEYWKYKIRHGKR